MRNVSLQLQMERLKLSGMKETYYYAKAILRTASFRYGERYADVLVTTC